MLVACAGRDALSIFFQLEMAPRKSGLDCAPTLFWVAVKILNPNYHNGDVYTYIYTHSVEELTLNSHDPETTLVAIYP